MTTVNAVNTYIVPTVTREVTMPLQPAFLATAANAANVVGSIGVSYQYGTAAMTEIFDQNADFNVNGTFTSPVTGQYVLIGAGYLEGCTINSACTIRLITSNRSYQNVTIRGASALDSAAICTVLADMDLGDTATCSIMGNGEAADTDDLITASGGHNVSYFSGFLAC